MRGIPKGKARASLEGHPKHIANRRRERQGHTRFMNWLRDVIGLDPLPHTAPVSSDDDAFFFDKGCRQVQRGTGKKTWLNC